MSEDNLWESLCSPVGSRDERRSADFAASTLPAEPSHFDFCLFLFLQINICSILTLFWVFFFFLSYLLDDAGNRLRFQLELEFVQCLANPNYLNCKLSTSLS